MRAFSSGSISRAAGSASEARTSTNGRPFWAGEQATEVALMQPTALEQHLTKALAASHSLLKRVLQLLLGKEPGPEDQRPQRDVAHRCQVGGQRGGAGHRRGGAGAGAAASAGAGAAAECKRRGGRRPASTGKARK